jgi:SAM-dependent methyltransferase
VGLSASIPNRRNPDLSREEQAVGTICRHEEAWTEFWQAQGANAGCCSHAPEIQRPIRDHWSQFAQSLTDGDRVLDLGCGNGAAGSALIRSRPSLRVTGVDFAAVPPSLDPRIEILPRTRMEGLPFADGCFDAAVSQFGFEYAGLSDASRELARVLRAGAPFSFLVHHSGARIAADSTSHRRALQAISATEIEAAFLSGNCEMLDRQLAQIRRRFPFEQIVDEAAQGLRRLIEQAPAHRSEIWRAVQAALAPEMTMLDGLASAAVAPEDMDGWLRQLCAWFELRPPRVLSMVGGQPLCWQVEGIRQSSLH